MWSKVWSFGKALLEGLFHLGAIYWVLGILVIAGGLSLILMRRGRAPDSK